jgi:hypothetical protein
MSKARCKKSFCDKGIHSTKEWRQAMIAKKKELQDSGLIMTQIESHPEYTHLAQCKTEAMNDKNEFMTKQQCSAMLSARSPARKQAPGYDYYPQWNKPGKWDARGPGHTYPPKASPKPPRKASPKAKAPSKAKTPKANPPAGKLPRCKAGTRRHPVSKLCVPKVKTSAKSAKAKEKAPADKLPRCKAGTRRHPVLKRCEPYPFK